MFNECLERTQNDQTTDVRDTTLKSTATWSLFRAASLSLKLCWKGFISSISSKGSWKLPPNCSSFTSHVLSTKPTEIFQKGFQRVTWMNHCNVISKDDVIYGAPLFPVKGRYFFSLFAQHVVKKLCLQFSKVQALYIAQISKMSMRRHNSISHYRPKLQIPLICPPPPNILCCCFQDNSHFLKSSYQTRSWTTGKWGEIPDKAAEKRYKPLDMKSWICSAEDKSSHMSATALNFSQWIGRRDKWLMLLRKAGLYKDESIAQTLKIFSQDNSHITHTWIQGMKELLSWTAFLPTKMGRSCCQGSVEYAGDMG